MLCKEYELFQKPLRRPAPPRFGFAANFFDYKKDHALQLQMLFERVPILYETCWSLWMSGCRKKLQWFEACPFSYLTSYNSRCSVDFSMFHLHVFFAPAESC